MAHRDDRRAAERESLFREVNERIVEAARRFEADEVEVVCECADPHCADRIPTSLAEYEGVRTDGARFLVRSGHEVNAFERVVRRQGSHRVVEKLREAGARARRLDPRARVV